MTFGKVGTAIAGAAFVVVGAVVQAEDGAGGTDYVVLTPEEAEANVVMAQEAFNQKVADLRTYMEGLIAEDPTFDLEGAVRQAAAPDNNRTTYVEELTPESPDIDVEGAVRRAVELSDPHPLLKHLMVSIVIDPDVCWVEAFNEEKAEGCELFAEAAYDALLDKQIAESEARRAELQKTIKALEGALWVAQQIGKNAEADANR